MNQHHRLLNAVIGALLLALGLTVLSGWLLHIPLMVQFKSGYVPMVFNTALCFSLTGVALALPGLTGRPSSRLQTGIGLTLIGLCSSTLVEIFFDKNLGIDWPALHMWINDGNTKPGRMAPNTALGFIAIGSVFVLMHRVAGKAQARAVQILTFTVLAIGSTGLVGYLLAPDLLFGWARSARMAVHTATGMILAGAALWFSWNRADWYRSRRYFREDEKIAFIGTAVLVVVTITAGLVGFVSQQSILENTLRQNLELSFSHRVSGFQETLGQTIDRANDIGQRQEIIELTRRLSAGSNDRDVAVRLNTVLYGLLSNSIQGITIVDAQGKPLSRAGMLVPSGEFVAPLPFVSPSFLFWEKSLKLNTDSPILDGATVVGRLVIQHSLDTLYQELFSTSEFGDTGEVGLCIDQGDSLLCIPKNQIPTIYRTKHISEFGKSLPMSLAVSGQSGVAQTYDYRGRNVIAAYSPLAPKLGLILKQDTVEMYAAIREQLKVVLTLLALLIMLGVLLLRSQLKPLALRLTASEALAADREQEISTLLQHVGDGILTIDEKGIIESFNPAASKIFGYAANAAIGQNVKILMPEEMHAQHDAGMRRYLQGGVAHVIGGNSVELPGLRQNGTQFPLELSINQMLVNNQRKFVGIVRDITERKRAQEKLIHMAQYDALTGLPNRALCIDRLTGALYRFQRNGKAIALMFIDMDGFKQINDTLGHHGGDELLKLFAARLLANVRKTDTVARFGGDEFVVILEEIAQPVPDAEVVAHKILQALQQPFLLDSKETVVTASIGIVVHANGEISMDALLKRADDAMYQAKKNGKNRVAFG